MKKISIYMIIIFLFIISLTIGFSSFQNTLEINDMKASIRYETDIRVTSIKQDSISSDSSTELLNYNIKNISGRLNLPSQSSYVIYKTSITNIGNTTQGILQLTGLTSSLKYQIVSCNGENPYQLGVDEIRGNGTIKEICIKIMPTGNSYNGDFIINTDFRTFHTVQYNKFLDTTNFQTSIMDGSTTLKMNTTEEFQITTDQGILLNNNSDYSYQNGIITFTTGVKSNLTIKSTRIIASVINGNGETVLGIMKTLANGTISNPYNFSDKNIHSFKRATLEEYNAIKDNLTSSNLISTTTTDDTYMWFENNTIYYYTEADVVKLNGSSARMFARMSALKDISGLEYFDMSNVTDSNRMFQDCISIEDLTPIANWDVSKITDMTFMFGSNKTATSGDYMKINSLSPLANWNVSNVTSMYQTFKGCGYLKNLKGLENWDVSNVTNMEQFFNHLGAASGLDSDAYNAIIGWDVRKVTRFNNMLNNTPSTPTKPIFTLRPGRWNTVGTYTASN